MARTWISLLVFLMTGAVPVVALAEDLIITAVFHADLEGAPNGVEVYAINDIPDLSIYGLGTADNGNGTNGEEFSFPSKSVSQGTYMYVVSKVDNFVIFFGFNPTYLDSDMKSNGNDAYELFKDGEVIDRYGDPDVNGRNTLWEYYYGWASRYSGSCPRADFDTDEWYMTGRDSLDNVASNDSLSDPIRVKQFTTDPDVCTPVEPEPTVDVVISDIQGTPDTYLTDDNGRTDVSPLLGQRVAIEATVVGDYQDDDADTLRNLGGYFLQEEGGDFDDDDRSSEGIFVQDSTFDVDIWDQVRVEGTVAEVDGETRIVDVTEMTLLAANDELAFRFTLGSLDLASIDSVVLNDDGFYEADLESWEGMLVQIQTELTLTDQDRLELLNEVTLTAGDRPLAFTEENSPSQSGYLSYLQESASHQLRYDDGESDGYAGVEQLQGFENYSTASAPRLGDLLATQQAGLLDYKGSGVESSGPTWRLRARLDKTVEITSTEMGDSPNPRPDNGPSAMGGDITLMTMNLNNWFITLDDGSSTTASGQLPVGADYGSGGTSFYPEIEYDQQLTKLTLALYEANADLIALTHIENDFDSTSDGSTALEVLVDAVNTELGYQRYDYVYPGRSLLGEAASAVALVYDQEKLELATGSTVAVLDDTAAAALPEFSDHDFEDDPVFDGADNNRPVLAASFAYKANQDMFTVLVSQMMGRSDSTINPASGANLDQNDGAGFWDDRRQLAADAIISWLATSPTGIEEPDVAVMGSMNAYPKESPVRTLLNAGFKRASSEYNSVTNGFSGSLDYLLLSEAFAQKRINSDVWHINADEAPALDYNILAPIVTPYFDGTSPARFSDRDPILAGMSMALPPEANAGDDQTVNEGVTVSLTAAASVAGDYPLASYQWTQLSGPALTFDDAESISPSFVAPEVLEDTDVELELTVFDSQGLSSTDQVVVTIMNLFNVPVADAGEDQTVDENSLVTLDGSGSSDPEDAIESYQWVQLSGTAVELTDASSSVASFTSPLISEDETLVFELTIVDDEGQTSSDQVSILVNNVPLAPVSDAGSDQTIVELTLVALSASNSSDPDDDLDSYLWEQISGTAVKLSSTTEIEVSFTAPNVVDTEDLIFKLTVTDATGLKSSDLVTVTVENVIHVPVADAGDDVEVNEGDIVSLSGADSTDEDGDIALYKWSQTSGSSVYLDDSKASVATFEAPEVSADTTLVFKLEVIDAFGTSSTDQISIRVIDVPKAPTIVLAQSVFKVGAKRSITLDASATTDVDGDLATFAWTQLSGPTVSTFSGENTSILTLTTPAQNEITGDIIFQVTATDEAGHESTAEVTISVEAIITQSEQVDLLTVNGEQETPSTGCSWGGGSAPVDPTLPMLALMSLVWIQRKRVAHCLSRV